MFKETTEKLVAEQTKIQEEEDKNSKLTGEVANLNKIVDAYSKKMGAYNDLQMKYATDTMALSKQIEDLKKQLDEKNKKVLKNFDYCLEKIKSILYIIIIFFIQFYSFLS